MIVEKHAFKAQFAAGLAPGFVIRVDTNFIERRDEKDAYEIFEDREAAEHLLADICGDFSCTTSLCVQEVTVESVRDYQRLKGFKTVYLVDRAGQVASSIRLGDMPLAARTNTPFPGPLPKGLRITVVKTEPGVTIAETEPVMGSEVGQSAAKTKGKPKLDATGLATATNDPFANEPVDDGWWPSARDRRTWASRRRPGVFVRFIRFLFGKP